MWQDIRVAWRFLLKRRTSTTIAALTLGIAVADLLYGVDPRDIVVVALAPAIVFAASAASWVAPARRAATADPVSILRSE